MQSSPASPAGGQLQSSGPSSWFCQPSLHSQVIFNSPLPWDFSCVQLFRSFPKHRRSCSGSLHPQYSPMKPGHSCYCMRSKKINFFLPSLQRHSPQSHIPCPEHFPLATMHSFSRCSSVCPDLSLGHWHFLPRKSGPHLHRPHWFSACKQHCLLNRNNYCNSDHLWLSVDTPASHKVSIPGHLGLHSCTRSGLVIFARNHRSHRKVSAKH